MTPDIFLEKLKKYPNDYFKANFAFDCFKGILKKVKSAPSSDHKDFIDQAVLYLTYSDAWIKEGLKELVCVAPKWRDCVYEKLYKNPDTNEVVLDGLFYLWSKTEENPPSFFWNLAQKALTNPDQVFLENSYMADRFHLYVKERARHLIGKGRFDQLEELKVFDTKKSLLMTTVITSDAFDRFTYLCSHKLNETSFVDSIYNLLHSSLSAVEQDRRMRFLFDHAPDEVSGVAWEKAWIGLEGWSSPYVHVFNTNYPNPSLAEKNLYAVLASATDLDIFERYSINIPQPKLLHLITTRYQNGLLTKDFVEKLMGSTAHLDHRDETCEMALGVMLNRGLKLPSFEVIDLMMKDMTEQRREMVLLHCIEQERVQLTKRLAKIMSLEQLQSISGRLRFPSSFFHDFLAKRERVEISKHISKPSFGAAKKKM